MRRGTVVVVIFVIVALAVVGISQFLRAQPPLEVTVAVSPLAERWLRASVDAFNATSPLVNSTRRVHFTVVPIEDMSVWQDDRRANWTPESHPVLWIPASSMTVTFAREARFPFEITAASLAKTPLTWGGFVSRVDAITLGGAAFDWRAVQEAAAGESWARLGGQAGWGFVKLAFDAPDQAIGGLAVLLSGAAAFADTPQLTPTITNDREFRAWLEPVAGSVANFNTLGSDPAAAMASRGASVADMGLLPESRWLTSLDGLARGEGIRFAYPQYPFVFDFPAARWNDPTATPADGQAADALVAWLLGAAQQSRLADYGLRPATGAVPANAPLFAAAQPYGVLPDVALEPSVAALSRTETQRLLQWFNGVR